jgi:hypothetical protein
MHLCLCDQLINMVLVGHLRLSNIGLKVFDSLKDLQKQQERNDIFLSKIFGSRSLYLLKCFCNMISTHDFGETLYPLIAKENTSRVQIYSSDAVPPAVKSQRNG